MSVTSSTSANLFQIQVLISPDPRPPEEVVDEMKAISGQVDMYCWYEGPKFLPEAGAAFMTERIFRPLFAVKKDVKLCLYSLKAWDFGSRKIVDRMPDSTRLVRSINRINARAIECICSSQFFKYWAKVPPTDPVLQLMNAQFPQKAWLRALSNDRTGDGFTVGELFGGTSPFNWLQNSDVQAAYAFLQYIEGFYLVRESVAKALEKGQASVHVAFVLPNDECKYYRDFPEDVRRILPMWFGERVENKCVTVYFKFFQYGSRQESRPYLAPSKSAGVGSGRIGVFFEYLSQRV